MGSAFHQLCPRYSGTLTPTAPTAIKLWDTFTFTFYVGYNFQCHRGVLLVWTIVGHKACSLTNCILGDSSTVICWTSLFVIFGVTALFCCFYSIFDGKSCDQTM